MISSQPEGPLYLAIRGGIKSALDAHPGEITTSSITKRVMGAVSSWRCPQSSHDSFPSSLVDEHGDLIRHTHVSEVEFKTINRTVSNYLRGYGTINPDDLAKVLLETLQTDSPTPGRKFQFGPSERDL